jgi:hypothetical protein
MKVLVWRKMILHWDPRGNHGNLGASGSGISDTPGHWLHNFNPEFEKNHGNRRKQSDSSFPHRTANTAVYDPRARAARFAGKPYVQRRARRNPDPS